MRQITSFEHVHEILRQYHAREDWIEREMYALTYPLYMVQLHVTYDGGHYREMNRKERASWLRDRGELADLDRPRRLLFHYLNVHGVYFFDDYVMAIEFKLSFS